MAALFLGAPGKGAVRIVVSKISFLINLRSLSVRGRTRV